MIKTTLEGDSEPTSARSRNEVSVRLPAERWKHIEEEHPELADLRAAVLEAIANPEYVVEGNSGELLALRQLGFEKALVVASREVDAQDGFVITAFITSRIAVIFKRRRQLWPSFS